MFDNKKNVLIGVLVLGVVAMTVAFAAFSTNLRISGTASVPDTDWNIHFDNWALDTASTVNGHQNTAEYPTVNNLQKSLSPNITLVEDLNITLKQPGDYVKYTFEIVNAGSIDASLDNFEKNLTCASGNDCSHLSYEIECKDAASGGNNVLGIGSVLSVNQRAYCSLILTYNDQINQNSGEAGEVQTYTQTAASASLDANWQYVQKKNYYSYQTSSGSTDSLPSTNYYLKTNISTNNKEVCGVFRTGTVCLTNNSTGRNSDFQDCNSSEVYKGTGSTCLNGYTKAKADEMISIGASGCTLNSERTNVVCNYSNDAKCTIYRNGSVSCYSYAHLCSIDAAGNSNCH